MNGGIRSITCRRWVGTSSAVEPRFHPLQGSPARTPACTAILIVMLGISPRAARITWTIFVIAALLVFLYAIRSTVLVFMTAMFFAYVLWPLVALIERHAPRWMGRTVALTIVYVFFWRALVAILVTVGVHLFEQASSLAQNVHVMINKGTWLENLPSWLGPARDHIIE